MAPVDTFLHVLAYGLAGAVSVLVFILGLILMCWVEDKFRG